MASGFKVNGNDLDTLLAPVGGSPYGSNTGYEVTNGDGVQGDIKNRYRVSSGGDQMAGNTGYKVGGADIKTLFRRFGYSGAPYITVQPTNQQTNETATATFSLTATGDATLAYQWRKNGSNLSNGGDISGATSNTLQIANTDASDADNYDCVVSNGVSPNATSNSVSLTVILIPVINNAAVGGGQFNVENGNISFNEGDGPVLKVTTSAGQNLHYQWKLDGSNVGSDQDTYSFTVSGSTDGTYTCVVSNGGGSDTSANCVVSIIAPVINGGTVCGGSGGSAPSGGGTYTFADGTSVASFNVTTSAGTNLSYVWKKDGVNQGINNAQGPGYDPAYFADAGVYSVEVTNGGGMVSASCTLVIT